jgi:hypothetical protein
MATVETKLFTPGDYGARRLTAADLKQLAQRGDAFLTAGIPIPVAPRFRNAAAMDPREELARRTAGNLGFVQGFTFRPSGLFAQCDVPDPAEAARLEAAGFVGVELEHDFTDGRGKRWPGPSIISLSLKTAATAPGRKNAVRLSLNDLKGTSMNQVDEEIKKLREALLEVRVILPEDCPSPATETVQFLRFLAAACVNAALEPRGRDDLDEEPEEPTPVMLSLARRLGDTELVADLEAKADSAARRKRERHANKVMRDIDIAMGRKRA